MEMEERDDIITGIENLLREEQKEGVRLCFIGPWTFSAPGDFITQGS